MIEQDMRHGIKAKRAAALVGMIGGWASFLTVGLWDSFTFDAHSGNFPPSWINFVLIGSVAVAISGGVAASRLALGRLLVDVFRAGLESSRQERQVERRDDAATQRHERADERLADAEASSSRQEQRDEASSSRQEQRDEASSSRQEQRDEQRRKDR